MAGPGTENSHLGKEPCPRSILLAVPLGAAAAGGGRGVGLGSVRGCRGQESRNSRALCLLFPPPPPSLFIDSASYSAETNLRFSQVLGPAAACIISQAATH